MVGKKKMACAKEKENIEVVRGETVEFIVNYDLFGVNIIGMYGTIARIDSGNGRPLVCVHEANSEWLEPTEDMYVRINPGVVSAESLKFLSKVRKLDGSKEH